VHRHHAHTHTHYLSLSPCLMLLRMHLRASASHTPFPQSALPTCAEPNCLTRAGFNVVKWTGDDPDGELAELRTASIICTTPEKWHSTTKRWRDQHEKTVASAVGLVLIVRGLITSSLLHPTRNSFTLSRSIFIISALPCGRIQPRSRQRALLKRTRTPCAEVSVSKCDPPPHPRTHQPTHAHSLTHTHTRTHIHLVLSRRTNATTSATSAVVRCSRPSCRG